MARAAAKASAQDCTLAPLWCPQCVSKATARWRGWPWVRASCLLLAKLFLAVLSHWLDWHFVSRCIPYGCFLWQICPKNLIHCKFLELSDRWPWSVIPIQRAVHPEAMFEVCSACLCTVTPRAEFNPSFHLQQQASARRWDWFRSVCAARRLLSTTCHYVLLSSEASPLWQYSFLDKFFFFSMLTLTGVVHPRMKMLPSVTHPHVAEIFTSVRDIFQRKKHFANLSFCVLLQKVIYKGLEWHKGL